MTTPQPPNEPLGPTGTTTAEPGALPNLGPSKRKRRKRRGLWLRRTVALLILAGLLGGVGVGLSAAWRAFMPAPALNLGGATAGEPLNVLVIGVDPTPVPQDDSEKGVRRIADTLQVLSLNYRDHRGFVLAIPRDTRATMGKNGDGPLGDALALGGIPLLKDTVEELTGLTIHHYVWLDMDGAKDLVKQIGGVEAYFPKPVKFQDAGTGLALDVPSGWQQLTPEQTLAYAYHRDPGGDLDRLARQQHLLAQWQQKIHGPFAGFWFSGASEHAMQDITTDLPKADFAALANEWRRIDPRDLSYALLPGEVSPQGEWLMSPQRWDALLPRLQAQPGARSVADAKPTVELLYNDQASEKVMALADALTKQGFQVLRTSVAQDVSPEENVIVDRTRADERSQPVLTALDAAVKGGARVVVDPGDVNGYGAQYTIKLGKGFFR